MCFMLSGYLNIVWIRLGFEEPDVKITPKRKAAYYFLFYRLVAFENQTLVTIACL